LGVFRSGKRKKAKEDPRVLNWGWGSLEADFQRFYGLNLNEEVFGKDMSMRRLLVLIRGLPADSAFGYFLDDDTNRDAASFDLQNITDV
jgi:hypothetical protein